MKNAPVKLTDAQYVALNTVLANGGLWSYHTSCGKLVVRNEMSYRKRKAGDAFPCINRRLYTKLHDMGLIEETHIAGARQFTSKAFVTAAGCKAVNHYRALRAVKGA